MTAKKVDLLRETESFYTRYLSFPSQDYPLVGALYAAATYLFPHFDAFGYLIITADTKRAGKSRFMELLSFVASNPVQIAGMTPATIFHAIKEQSPTLLMDEAESISGEAAGVMRSLLNVGYRQGATIPRMGKGNQVEYYPAYCPKVFILIGDMFDTVRDRSIIIRMRRGESPERFVRNVAMADGNDIGARLHETLTNAKDKVMDAYVRLRLDFLNDRDEEIWLPLFAVCSVLAPERMDELKRVAVDMATEKTQGIARYTAKEDAEEAAADDEYAQRLLADLHGIMRGKHIYTDDAIKELHALVVAPWRKYKGDAGLNSMHMSNLLSRFQVNPVPIRTGKKGTKTEKVARGYRWETVDVAFKRLNDGK